MHSIFYSWQQGKQDLFFLESCDGGELGFSITYKLSGRNNTLRIINL